MAFPAWPFLIAPTDTAPPRLVSAPDWMLTDQRLIAGLRYSPIQVAASDLGTPGAPAVLMPVCTDAGDFCVVYRVLRVRMSDYDLGSDEPARDHVRRQIEAIEGLVLCCDEEEAALLRIGTADLDKAHTAVTGPYQSYWRQPRSFRLEGARSFPLSGRGDPMILNAPASLRTPGTRNAGRGPDSSGPGALGSDISDQRTDTGSNGDQTGPRRDTKPKATPGPDPYRQRGRMITVGIAAAVVLAAIGIAIARPWSSPAVQPPQSLRSHATSATAITITWSPPVSGAPDHYELYLDGKAIRIPGTAISHQVTHLTPVTRYRVQLWAFANGTRSRPSNVVMVTTPTPPEPPLWQTLLWGRRQTIFTPMSSSGAYRAGHSWSSWWTVTPKCGASSCPVAISGTINSARGVGASFSVALPLDAAGMAHTGDIQQKLEKCGATWVPATVTIKIYPAYGAAYEGGIWVALGWKGTLTIHNSAVLEGHRQQACPASAINVGFRS